jgi:hypothetical protein
MAAGSTYTPIATTTVSGSPTTISFTSISSSYTDLVLIANARGNASDTLGIMVIRFNNDSATNYSVTQMYGNGTTTASARVSNQTGFGLEYTTGNTAGSGVFAPVIISFNNYSNSTTNKTMLMRTNNPENRTAAQVGLYRSTTAISRIDISEAIGTNWAIGSQFTLYGISAA